MVTRNSDGGQSPWLPVYGGAPDRESVAPSKPAMPTAPRATPRPEPIDSDEADVIAPVTPPPPEEIQPWEPSVPSARSAAPSDSPAHRDPDLRPATGGDTYRALGGAAVHNASLSASGAPTPLGGVPQVPAYLRDSAPARAARDGSGSPATGDGDPAAPGLPDDGTPFYTPHFSTEAEPVTQPSDDGDGDSQEPPASARTPWWRAVPALVVAGLIVMGGIATGLYVGLTPDEEVELTPEVIVAPPETAPLEPIAVENPTDFQAAMPGIVTTFALTGIEAPALDSLDLPARAAEVTILTYSDSETELTLRAIQHYDTEAAVAQFEALAAEGTDREPVRAGGADAGERVTIAGEGGITIVWRNGTAVFELSGPADATEDFYSSFPL